MRELDLRNEEIAWWNREQYPIYKMSNQKILNQNYILKNNIGIEGTFDVKLMVGKLYRLIKDAEITTINGHTIISKYL